MRVLFSSTFGYGHIFPMLPLARAFQAAGHQVLWATSQGARDLVGMTGIETVSAGLSGSALREGVTGVTGAAIQVPPPERAAFVFPRMFGGVLTPPMVADLLPLARDWRPDLMIHEHGELASPLVGAVLGVPSVTHSFGGAIPAAILGSAAEVLAPLWREHGLEVPPYAGCFTSLYLDICPASVQSVPTAHISRVQALRPVTHPPTSDGPLPDYLDHSANGNDDRPLVYVTLGTVQNRSPVLPPVVAALAGLDVRLLVTVGPDGDVGALGEQPPHVRVETWVDQAQVLRHSSVVVSHAGSGTFLGALAAGLPQLCLPQAADQFRNAAGGSRAGAALVVPPPEVSQDTVAEAVRLLLTDDGFRVAAQRVAGEIRAMPDPADVVEVLIAEVG